MTRNRLWMPLGGIVLFFCAWWGASAIASAPSILPGPVSAMRSAVRLLQEGYWKDLLATSSRALAGWLLSILLGVPIGLFLGVSPVLHAFSRGVMAFLRSLPAFMLISLPIALGYGGEGARIATIVFANVLIVIDQCAESLLTLARERFDLIRAYRGSLWFILSRVLLFEALGRAVVPVARTTVSISFIVAIVVESLVTPSDGVGARLLTSLAGLDMASVYGFLLMTGIVGLGLNSGIHFLARRIIFWS